MSQAKVDYNKQRKAKNKQINKKEKRNRVLGWMAAVVIAAAAIGWFGFSVWQNGQPEQTVNIVTDYSAIDSYVNNLEAQS